jgi:hypothetical protein
MNIKDSIEESEPYILVEGPKWGDAEFYGKWLLAAAKAEALWKKAINDPIFEKQIEPLTICEIPDFGMGATVMLSQLKKNLASFTVRLRGEYTLLVEDFVMMVEMEFFVLTGQRYQMTIPTGLSMEKVKMAALKLAQAENEDFLHPEYLVATMPKTEAEDWQRRLKERERQTISSTPSLTTASGPSAA